MSAKKRFRLIAAAVAAGVTAGVPGAFAADNNWLGTTNNDWNTASNWSKGRVPNRDLDDPDEDAVVNTTTNFPVITADTPNPRDTKIGFANGTTGRVDQTGGTHDMNGWFYLGGGGGDQPGAVGTGNGTYNLSGGTLSMGRAHIGGVNFNRGGTGTMNQTGGTFTARDPIFLGESGNGSFNLGPAGTVNAPRLLVGVTATGAFTQTGGTVNIGNNDESRIGDAGGSTGTYTMSAGTFNVTGNFQVGGSGTGTFNQTGGTVNLNSDFPSIGRFTGGNGTHTISAGAINKTIANGAYIIGEQGTANLNVSGTGTVTVASNVLLGAATGGNGTVTQTGGTVSVGGDLLIAPNAGATGRYNLRGGTLDMTGGAVTPGPGTATVEFSGGRLLNAATINGPLAQTGGRLSPGASPGTTTINGAYTMTGTATYEAELASGGASDLVDVNGLATLTGGTLDLVPLGGLAFGQKFTILTYDTLAGTFAARPNGGTFSEDGLTFLINYADGGNNVTVQVVPEPAGLGVALAGAAGLLLRRRRGARA